MLKKYHWNQISMAIQGSFSKFGMQMENDLKVYWRVEYRLEVGSPSKHSQWLYTYVCSLNKVFIYVMILKCNKVVCLEYPMVKERTILNIYSALFCHILSDNRRRPKNTVYVSSISIDQRCSLVVSILLSKEFANEREICEWYSWT